MARFGVTIYFGKPDKKQFQEIVRELAKKNGIDMLDPEEPPSSLSITWQEPDKI